MKKNNFKKVFKDECSKDRMEKESEIESKFFYDIDYDSLMISQKGDNEKVKKNFMFDDIIISLTGKGKIVGLEIRDVSNFLNELGFNPIMLKKINSAKLIVQPKRDFIFIGFQLLSSENSPEFGNRGPVANIPISCIQH